MTSPRPSGSSHPVYRNPSRHPSAAPAQKPEMNGRAETTPSSSSGAVSRVSRSNSRESSLPLPSSPRQGPKSPESELTTSFDPMKDMHLWTMWRVAVNGRIMDGVHKRNGPRPSAQKGGPDYNPFGRALVKTPLDRFIRVENGSRDLAALMMDPHGQGGSTLATEQFVFYGVPRVVLKKEKNVVHLPGDPPE